MLSHHCDIVAAKNSGLYSSPGLLYCALARAVTQPFISSSDNFFKLLLKDISVSQQVL